MTLAQIGVLLSEIKAAVSGAPALAQENAELKTKLAAAEADKASALQEVAKLKSDSEASAKASADALSAEAAKCASAEAAKVKAEADKAEAEKAKAEAESKAQKLIDEPSAVALELAAKAGVKLDQRPKSEASGSEKKLFGLAAVRAAIESEITSAKR